MNLLANRTRLLGGAALGLAISMLAPEVASAQGCTIVTTNVLNDTCQFTSTTTTNTVAPANPPDDRAYPWAFGFANPTFFNVGAGVTVNGFGLAVNQSDASANSLLFTNNGLIQVDVGNAPSAGGTGALSFSLTDGSLNYSGTGDILNLGVGNGLEIGVAGTGSVTAAAGGDILSTTGNAIVLGHSGTSGNLCLTTAAGTTTRAEFIGIFASQGNLLGTGGISITNNSAIGSAGAPNTINFGIFTQSSGLGSLTVVNNGAIGSVTDRTIGTGLGAVIFNAGSTAGINVSGSGAIFGQSAGILAGTSGSGNVTVNYSGPIDTGSNGIDASSVGGNITITAGAITTPGFNGIIANASGAGVVSVTTTGGTVTGVRAIRVGHTGSGATTVTTGSGAVNGTALGVLIERSAPGIGTDTVTIGSGGATGGIDGVAMYAFGVGPGLQAVNANGAVTGTTGSGILSSSAGARAIVVGSAGTVTGGAQAIELQGAGAATIGNAGTIGAASTGLALDTLGTGAVTLNNNTTGTLNGRLTFNAGNDTLANQGIFNTQGTTNFGGGADTLTNTGAINLTGATTFANLEAFNQNGLINLGTFTLTGPAIALINNGTIDTGGAAGLAGFTSLDNVGTLDLAAGTFTAPAGLFTNSGLILADEGTTNISGQASFANSGTIDLSDGLTNDQLTIFSDFAGSGGSTLMLDVDDGIADQLIISGAASGSTAIDVNLIGTGILDSGNVLLVTTQSATVDAFVLGDVTGNVSPLFDYGVQQNDDQFYLVSTLNEVGFAPLPVTLIAGEYWYQSAEAVWAQAKLPNDGTNRMGLWGQIYASHDEAGDVDGQSINGVDSDADNRVESDRFGMQAGWAFPLGGMGSVGVTAGFGRADIDGNASSYQTNGFNLGAYGTFGGATGIHGSLLAKHDRFKVEIENSLFEDASPDGRSNGIDGEVGYRFGGISGPAFGVSAGLSHVRTKIDDFSIAGLGYDYDSMTSTRGRVGMRATGSGPISPFLDVRAYHEFSGDGEVRLSDGVDSYRLRADGRGTWVRAEVGVGGPASGLAPMVSAWVDLGDVKGFGGRGSFRF